MMDCEKLKEEIIGMVKQIKKLEDLEMIYGMVQAAHKEVEKAEGD